jgi:glycosyltransferase involved in cell wall biosynthesis
VVSKARKYVDLVVVIDDGSHDGTVEAARVAGAQVINHSTNRGYGEAIKSCFEAAKANAADVLVTLDGDGQHNPEEIPKVLDPISRKEADLVIGSRFLQPDQSRVKSLESRVMSPPPQPFSPDSRLPTPDSRPGTIDSRPSTPDYRLITMPRYRKFGISVITFLWNFGSKVKVSDSQSGFRAYSKEMFANTSFSEKGMSISIEILEKARRKRAVIKEVPISCLYAPSTIGLKASKHGISVALGVVRIRLKNSLFGMDKEA